MLAYIRRLSPRALSLTGAIIGAVIMSLKITAYMVAAGSPPPESLTSQMVSPLIAGWLVGRTVAQFLLIVYGPVEPEDDPHTMKT